MDYLMNGVTSRKRISKAIVFVLPEGLKAALEAASCVCTQTIGRHGLIYETIQFPNRTFCEVISRDMFLGRAWVYLPNGLKVYQILDERSNLSLLIFWRYER